VRRKEAEGSIKV